MVLGVRTFPQFSIPPPPLSCRAPTRKIIIDPKHHCMMNTRPTQSRLCPPQLLYYRFHADVGKSDLISSARSRLFFFMCGSLLLSDTRARGPSSVNGFYREKKIDFFHFTSFWVCVCGSAGTLCSGKFFTVYKINVLSEGIKLVYNLRQLPIVPLPIERDRFNLRNEIFYFSKSSFTNKINFFVYISYATPRAHKKYTSILKRETRVKHSRNPKPQNREALKNLIRLKRQGSKTFSIDKRSQTRPARKFQRDHLPILAGIRTTKLCCTIRLEGRAHA